MQQQKPFDQGDMVVPYPYMQPSATEMTETGRFRVYRDIEFAMVRGFRPLLLDLTVPKTADGPVPLVLYIHPGAWLTGSHKRTEVYRCMNGILDGLSEAGFAVASVQYRLSSEALFPACLHDVVAAVRWLRHFAPELGLDPCRFAAWGESCGGQLAALLGMNVKDEEMLGSVGVIGVDATVQAAVIWYGTTDFLRSTEQSLPGTRPNFETADAPGARLLGAPIRTVPEKADRASPIHWVSTAAAPMFFVHGELDLTTPPEQSRSLCRALQAAGAEAQMTMVPNADHELKGVDPAPYMPKSVAFLDSLLRRIR